jgi:hypothetical protein
MDERTARDVIAVRAVETVDAAREIWSDADRVWASTAAAEAVGEHAAADAFLGRRAALALQRLAKRHPRFVAATRAHALPRWILPGAAAAAFIAGAAGVDIGADRRINLLSPPLLGLLAWNLVVYGALIVGALRRAPRVRAATTWVDKLAVRGFDRVSRRTASSAMPPLLGSALARFTAQWSSAAAPLWRHRVAALLHVGAAALAAGAIAGLYVRGIALEYRAGWQSTFLDATHVAWLLQHVLAAGAWLTGIPVADAAHVRAIGSDTPGENAARWIHLYAATIALVVIVPRLALAAAAWHAQWRSATRVAIDTGDPYFRQLLRGWAEGPARILALPYSFDVPSASAEGLAQTMTRALQSSVRIEWARPHPYGGDDLPDVPAATLAGAVAVFSLGATPERETHGAFLRALAGRLGQTPLIPIIDTSEFADRFRDQPRRIDERRLTWQRTLAAEGFDALFIRLASPDLADSGAAIAARFATAAQ